MTIALESAISLARHVDIGYDQVGADQKRLGISGGSIIPLEIKVTLERGKRSNVISSHVPKLTADGGKALLTVFSTHCSLAHSLRKGVSVTLRHDFSGKLA